MFAFNLYTGALLVGHVDIRKSSVSVAACPERERLERLCIALYELCYPTETSDNG